MSLVSRNRITSDSTVDTSHFDEKYALCGENGFVTNYMCTLLDTRNSESEAFSACFT